MKKLFLVAVVAITALVGNAQVWMGGSLGLGFSKPEGGETTTTLTIAPEIGYTLNEKWDIAIGIRESLEACDGNTANQFSVNPYARFTFAKAGIASFFVDGGFSVGCYDAGKGYDATTAWNIGFRPGVKLAISEKVCFVSTIGFLGFEQVVDQYSDFGFNFDNNALSFGMYWSF